MICGQKSPRHMNSRCPCWFFPLLVKVLHIDPYPPLRPRPLSMLVCCPALKWKLRAYFHVNEYRNSAACNAAQHHRGAGACVT